MITDALRAYIDSNTSMDVYIAEVPLGKEPYLVIEDLGYGVDRHFGNDGHQTNGLISQEYEATFWSRLQDGGAKNSAQQADVLVDLLDNFSGPMIDTAASPNVSHRVAMIEATKSGQDYSQRTKLYGYTVFISLIHA